MFASVLHIELGEIITGGISALIIAMGVVTSIIAKKKIESAEPAAE
jgi:hypothetical protein